MSVHTSVCTWQGVGPHALVMDERKCHEQQKPNDVGDVEHLQQVSLCQVSDRMHRRCSFVNESKTWPAKVLHSGDF